jgi:Na+/melibiose symporter-like transporter
MDRTSTPLGRYRAWLLAGVPVFMFATWMLFMAPVGMSGGYLVLWLFILYLGNSVLTLSHSAWTGTLVTEYHQRSRVFGILATAGIVASIAVLVVPIVAKMYGVSGAASTQAMGWFVIALTPISIGLTVAFTKETITRDHVRSEHAAWRDYLDLFKRRELVRLFLAQICLTLGPGWMSALYIFFFGTYLGFSQDETTWLLILYIMAGVVGAPTTARLAMQFGKHRTLLCTTSAYSLGLMAILFAPPHSLLVMVPVMLWCGAMAAGFDLLNRAMLADVSDEIRLEQGKERISLLYAVIALAAKLAAAGAILLSYQVLNWIGFNPLEGAVNSPAVLKNLEIAYLAGPIVFVMLGGACVVGWRLDAKRHADVRAQLDEMDARYTEAPILESITGTPSPVVLAANSTERD